MLPDGAASRAEDLEAVFFQFAERHEESSAVPVCRWSWYKHLAMFWDSGVQSAICSFWPGFRWRLGLAAAQHNRRGSGAQLGDPVLVVVLLYLLSVVVGERSIRDKQAGRRDGQQVPTVGQVVSIGVFCRCGELESTQLLRAAVALRWAVLTNCASSAQSSALAGRPYAA